MNNADIRYANAELSKRPKPQAKTADTLLMSLGVTSVTWLTTIQ